MTVKTLNKTRRNRHPKKRPYRVWTDDEDALLRKVYPYLSHTELKKLFPNRTPDAIDMRASCLGLRKTQQYISAKNSANPSKHGIAHFADFPVEALAEKHPDLKRAYDSILDCLLCHPAVDPSNTLQVELLKEAVLFKISQFILMHDRIINGLKGKQLFVNVRTGSETWVEARYPHSLDISNDAKMARQILKDLGIIEEMEKKVDISSNLHLLWEEDPDDEDAGESDMNVAAGGYISSGSKGKKVARDGTG